MNKKIKYKTGKALMTPPINIHILLICVSIFLKLIIEKIAPKLPSNKPNIVCDSNKYSPESNRILVIIPIARTINAKYFFIMIRSYTALFFLTILE